MPERKRAQQVSVFQTIRAFSHLRAEDIQGLDHQTLQGVIVTAYSLDVRSTGKTPSSVDYGITFSGTRATVGRTVAVDPRVIPIGTPVFIDVKGVGWRIAEDTGGAIKGRHIDLLLDSEAAAVQFGVKRQVRVYVPNGTTVQVLTESLSKP